MGRGFTNTRNAHYRTYYSCTYIVKDGTIFCDVADQNKSIVVELKDEDHKKLIIEVENVNKTINILRGV